MEQQLLNCRAARARARLIALGVMLPLSTALAQQTAPEFPECRPAGAMTRLAEVPEASGIAASRRTADRLYTLNDSGAPRVFVLDLKGAVIARVDVAGAKNDDWEAIAVGPCPAGSCIYIADIGDNNRARDKISIYRLPEPDGKDAPRGSDVFHATYPDGRHDAETLLIAPDGRLFIVTKGENGPIALYAFPRELQAGVTVRLTRIGQPRSTGTTKAADRITDGSVSEDGRWVALRTENALLVYSAADLLAGNWREVRRIDLTPLREPQGEGVTFDGDNVLYLAGEGGRFSNGGTLARLACGR